ncbi:hypothetical protein Tco_1146681 [Tanacetum coccineum]
MSKVLQERGFGSLPSSTKTNPRDHVKSISTCEEVETPSIRRIRCHRYGVSIQQKDGRMSLMELNRTTIPFLGRLRKYGYDMEEIMATMKSHCSKILKHALPLKEKDPGMVEYMDAYRDEDIGDVIVRIPFCKASCIEGRRFDGLITIHDGNDNVTYQMARSHPRFKHLTNAQCNKIQPLLKVSARDKLEGISHPYRKLIGFYKGVLNLGPKYVRDAKTVEWLIRGHMSMHEME